MFDYFIKLLMIHLFEHATQMFQLYILNWDREKCLGFIGFFFPFLVKSELLHFVFALLTLIGLSYYLYKFKGNCYKLWRLSYYLQIFHFIEHIILMSQKLIGLKPFSLGQLFLPRIELHFFYNLMVLLPIIGALSLYYKNQNTSKSIGEY